jgi:hypothetical protein
VPQPSGPELPDDFDDDRLPSASGDELASALEALAAATRADDAAAARRRTGWLARQAEEEATLAGTLIDLAERQRAVVVASAAGQLHRGWVHAVGRDFVAVRRPHTGDVLVPFDAITSVRSHRGDPPVLGDRPLALEATLAGALQAAAAARPRVLVLTAAPGEAVQGELRWVGRDVLAVRLDGGGGSAYVPLAAVREVSAPEPLVR